MKNTSITLTPYFDDFIQAQVSSGRYKNVSEVIRAGLRLLEQEEAKSAALRSAINEGIESGMVKDFDPDENLRSLKSTKSQNGHL